MKRVSSNEYANICYNVLGNTGYIVFLLASLMDIYGGKIGSMVVMTDFVCGLPFFQTNAKMWRIIVQSILTVIGTILCILKNVR